jgi:hypothetical protein
MLIYTIVNNVIMLLLYSCTAVQYQVCHQDIKKEKIVRPLRLMPGLKLGLNVRILRYRRNTSETRLTWRNKK